MPGILGLISDKPETQVDFFSRMLESVNHFNYRIDSTSIKNVQFGHVHLNYIKNKNDFAKSNDGRYILALCGEIFSYKNIETNQIDDDQEFLLSIFIRDGIDCLKLINGLYSAAIYDFVEEKLYLISDRMGTRPVYYTHENNSFVFAPEVKAILKSNISKVINYDAISELFSYGHLFGHKTLFSKIAQLPEASYLVLSNNKINIFKYWDFPEYADAYKKDWPNKKTINDITDEFIAVFTTAMKRNFTKNNDKILLSLSGGLDSRYVAAFAKKLGVNPLVAFTMGADSSEDQIYAKQVSEILGIQHNQFVINPQNIWRDAERFGYYSDNMSMINGPIQGFEAIESFSGKTEVTIASQMCDALFGSTLVRKKFKSLIDKKEFDEEAKKTLTDCFNIFKASDLDLIFTKDFNNKIKNRSNEIPQQYINSTNIPIHAYLNMLINEHVRRGTLGGNLMYNLYMETRMPSYDNDVIDFAYRLPLKLREYQYLYRGAFTRLFPDLAKIKREHFNIPIDASITRYKLSTLEKKITVVLKNSPANSIINKINKYNRPSYVNYNGWFKNELNRNMKDILLNKKTLSRGVFNEDGLKLLIQQHQNPRQDHSRLLWQAINLEYYFRNFID